MSGENNKLADKFRAALATAIARFNASNDPKKLLCPLRTGAKKKTPADAAAAERAIAHRLAFYLEDELRKAGLVRDDGPLSVDCEYDRHFDAYKMLEAPDKFRKIVKEAKRRAYTVPNKPGYFRFSVAPDIIVHKPRTDALNLLIIELKKVSNKEGSDYDDLKLTLFTTPKPLGFGYRLGARVVARDDLPASKRCLEIVKEYAAA